MSTDYIVISPFSAGETVKLNWTWEFKETGTPQNDAQNAVLRFNISYMLVVMPAPPTTAPTWSPVPTPTPPGGGGDDGGDDGGGGGGGGGTSGSTSEGGSHSPFTGSGAYQEDAGYCSNSSQNYTAGFEGMLYNADNERTLDLNVSSALKKNTTVTIYPDHIDVYQRDLTIYPDHTDVDRRVSGVLFRFWMDTSDIGNATRIVKKADSAELWTDPLVANLTTGRYSGSIHAIPLRIFPQSTIRITLTDCITPGITGEVRNVSAENNLGLMNIPCAMHVERFNRTEIGETNVTMTVPLSWVDRQGGRADLVHIAMLSNENTETTLLTTAFAGNDSAANMIFRGNSPHGSSLYAIFSARSQENSEQSRETVQSPAISVPAMQSWWSNPLLTAAILSIMLLVLVIIYFRRFRKMKS
jgi:hypothetical protein